MKIYIIAFILIIFFNSNLSAEEDENKLLEQEKVKYEMNFMHSNIFNYSLEESLGSNSMFFSKQQIEKLDKLLIALKEGEEIKQSHLLDEDEQKELELSNANKKSVVTNVRFYLDSILYTSKSEWILWVNGKSYNNNNLGNNEFKIENVAKDKVLFSWTTGYSKFVDILSNSIEENQIPSEVSIEISDSIAYVYFYLKPNQAFLLNNNVSILEGKI